MTIHVKSNVHWVGVHDWETEHFHGKEYHMNKGTSYNSYLIREEKTVLVDTVDHRFTEQFLANLEVEIDINDIDYIICQHAEEDHSGALSALLAKIPNTPVYCTEAGVNSIVGHHHQPDWNFRTVKTGDTLDVGNGKQLIFVEMKMLHWPDSMATYLTGDEILFSNDAFGQHYCDENLFNDQLDQVELHDQCLRYFSNILTPLVKAKIEEVLSLGVPIDVIATSHGCIWRDNATQIVEQYYEWSKAYKEDRITIVYDTMSNNTRMMADAIAKGIRKGSPETAIKVFNISKHDKNDILANIFRSKGVLVGSSTMNNVMMPQIAALLEEIHGLRFAEKRAAAFGSSGWTGGAVKRIDARLREANFEVSAPQHIHWKPDTDALRQCIDYGMTLAEVWRTDANEVSEPKQVERNVQRIESAPTSTPTELKDTTEQKPEESQDKSARSADCTCWRCTVCEWVYDPQLGEPYQGVEPGTPWAQVPDDFLCPECHLGKEVFMEK
ncbi:nitric oxide reductase [Vibrio kanaloae]|uniref:anaerobic nitric oxide reductase flavorubredoxin n=1 Tax=Vibrio kanaloae TaxID=170673 RepID=UPI000C822748|nr:anaerobic nitric oxide reductase flavorubredoxin [Vibrio kanaloae]PMM06424.1 nitric oxide reductase [Vibrio kanaloae]